MKIDQRALQKVLEQAQRIAETRAEELLTKTIEGCYCATHGRFASVTSQATRTGEGNTFAVDYETGCPELRTAVENEF